MKKFILLLLLIFAIPAISVRANLKRFEITQSNYDDFLTSETYSFFMIKSPIVLSPNDTIKVGSYSVLSFEGGCFIGGCIDINGAVIQAADYCIFDGTTLITEKGETCSFGNDVVSAIWFKKIGADGDIGPVVNHALKTAPNCIVTLNQNMYTLNTSIILDKEGQSLRYGGTFRLTADTPAICMRASNLLLDVGTIERTGTSGSNDTRSSGIEFDGRTTYTDIKIRNIRGTRYGLSFIPNLNNAKLLEEVIACETSYTKIDFGRIETQYGIYFDLFKGFLDLPEDKKNINNHYSTWVTEVLISGGCIDSPYGIYFEDRPTEVKETVTDNGKAAEYTLLSCESEGNEFIHITFGDRVRLPLHLCSMSHTYFPYTVLSDRAKENATWIKMRRCKHVEVGLMTEMPYGKVEVHDSVWQSVIKAPITGPGVEPRRCIDRMYVQCNGYWHRGSSTKYLSSSMQSNNMVNTLDYPTVSTVTQTALTLTDLLAGGGTPVLNPTASEETPAPLTVGSGPVYLSDICVLNIGDNRRVTIDLTQNVNIITAPVTLVVNHVGKSKSGLLTCKLDEGSALSQFLSDGTYRLTWDNDCKPQITKVG